MSDYNFIVVGDHCAPTIIIKDLGLRKASYPFDWVVHNDQVLSSNLYYNLSLITRLNESNAAEIASEFIGDAFSNTGLVNSKNNIWFPHDKSDDAFSKYQRRFSRLYTDLREKKNCFIIVTRCFYIHQQEFDKMINLLIGYNKANKIIFISGINHEYLSETKYKTIVNFKYIFYHPDWAFEYDNTTFRPIMKKFIESTVSTLV
jgi:hypothetical protein